MGAGRNRLSMARTFEHWRVGFIIANDWFQAASSPDRLSSLDPELTATGQHSTSESGRSHVPVAEGLRGATRPVMS